MILLAKGAIIIIVVTVVLIGLLVALYFWGNKLQEKQLEQREQINAASQPATLFIIDKKIMPMRDAKLPKMVMEQAPKRYQKAKIPVVKAKVSTRKNSIFLRCALSKKKNENIEISERISMVPKSGYFWQIARLQ